MSERSPDILYVGVASERLGLNDPPRIINRMATGSPPKIQIPRWIQLVTLPLLLLLIWAVAGAVRHVVFLFLVAGLIALLLNPLVRGLMRARIPRGLGVATVYLLFAAVVAAASIALGTVVVDQTKSASHRIDAYFTKEHGQSRQTHADRDVDRLQAWLDDHGLARIKIRKQAHDFVDNIRGKDVQKYTTKVIDFVEGAAIGTVKLLFSLVLLLVISIYMLLDMDRLSRVVNRRFPPHDGSPPLLNRIERSLAGYVKGQALLSLIIGVSAGLGLYLLGLLGLGPGLDKYAVLFGAWVAFTELIPYLGPWLGAVPPVIYELIVHPISALWVALLFLFIHQVEGHVVVPNVMGSALQLHPLLVIFGLLAGGEIYGLPGVFVALPLLAAGRAMWEFFSERVTLERWQATQPVLPVEVEVEPAAESPVRVRGPGEGARGNREVPPDAEGQTTLEPGPEPSDGAPPEPERPDTEPPPVEAPRAAER
jgi:predicted PurR-regulated permease PerM